MTEPIIIDGVDVKDCKRRIGKDNFCRYYKRPCTENNYNCIWKKYLRKKQECERLKQGYAESTEIVSPYIDDFTGYNEELGGFDIVLCVKQLLEQLKISNEKLNKQYNCYACDTCNGKEDYIHLKRHCENAIKSLHNKQVEFEQLKAENEQLKTKVFRFESKQTSMGEQNKELIEDNLNLSKENSELKAENEGLKEWQETVKDLFNRTCKCKYLKQEAALCGLNNKECVSINECMYRKHQALIEIKEIAEKMKKMSEEECGELTECFFKDKQCEKCSKDKCLVYWFDKILQKISEVEEQC